MASLTSSITVEIPANLADFIKHPEKVEAAFKLLNILANANIQVIPQVGISPSSTRGLSSIAISGQNAVIPVPVLVCSGAVADSNSLTVSTQLNALLAKLREAGILPT